MNNLQQDDPEGDNGEEDLESVNVCTIIQMYLT